MQKHIQIIKKHQDALKHKITKIELDEHWFRRVFHTFSACFLAYYLLPDAWWGSIVKYTGPTLLFFLLLLLEYGRIKGKYHMDYFFGLRRYETKRPASYLYFGAAVIILLLFFPQQIAIPCILCGCFADPIMGELRKKGNVSMTFSLGLLCCFLFFLISWHTTPLFIALTVSFIGAFCAVLGEMKKFLLIDDDFMIQMIPALVLGLLWQGLLMFEIDILPKIILYPYSG